MPEFPSIANPDWVKYAAYILGMSATVSSGLIIYIFAWLRKEVEKIKKIQDLDHDRINTIETEQNIYHQKN